MKTQFFVKLIPPRATFGQDITPEEAAIMGDHSVYWAEMMKQGRVRAYGPVLDPDGFYGMGIAEAENADEVREWMSHDPASVFMTYTVVPMRAFLPS